jgi:hypothetical protein
VTQFAAFYGGLGAASFTVFAIGAGFTTSRLLAMRERAALVNRELGDLMNQRIDGGVDQVQRSWKERARRNELADLGEVERRGRAMAYPLLLSVAVGMMAFANLAGWGTNSTWYRAMLLALFGLSIAGWLGILLVIATSSPRQMRSAVEARRRERQAATDAGQPFMLSGDPEALVAAADGLESLLPRRLGRWRMARWRRAIRRDSRPSL